MSEDIKPQNPDLKTEKPKHEVRIVMKVPATLSIEIDLDRVNPAWARGALLNADDVIKSWYIEQAELKHKSRIVRPNVLANAKQSFKNFIARK